MNEIIVAPITGGVYSSANGNVYPNGFTDIQSGDSYGRTVVKYPINGTGDGNAYAPDVYGWEVYVE